MALRALAVAMAVFSTTHGFARGEPAPWGPPQDPAPSFRGGDLYLLGNSIPLDSGGSGYAILKTDPASGQQTIFRELSPGGGAGELQNIDYDHFRDRLVFYGRRADGQRDFWLLDAAGNLTSLGFPDDPYGITSVASANDGRIYFFREGVRLLYLDASNVARAVTNLAGSGPALLSPPDAIHFDAGTNSLVLLYGTARDFFYCGGTPPDPRTITIRRVVFDEAGSRIVSDECAVSDVLAGVNNATIGSGLSNGPDGKLIATFRDFLGGSTLAPRMLLVDPLTLEFEIFAYNGPYLGSASVNAGCYSSFLDRAVIVDAAGRLANGANNARLRTFFRGQLGGNGDVLGDRLVNSGSGTISWMCEIDKPRDTEPPTVSILEPADGAVLGSTSVPTSAEVLDESATSVTSNPAGLAASLAPGGGIASGSVPLDLEGPNLIAVQAIDSAGNAAGTSVTVVRDTLAPELLITAPADGMVFGASPISLHASVLDATGTTVAFGAESVILAAGGGAAAFEAALVDGSNLLEVFAVDAAGNLSRREVTAILDESAPLVAILTPLPGEWFGAGESVIPVEVSVDDVTATSVSSEPQGVAASLPAGGGIATGAIELAEGDNVIVATATDALDRAASAIVTVRLDTTGPTVVIESPAATTPARGTVDFAAAVGDSLPGTGVVRVDFLVDGALVDSQTAPPFATPFDTSSAADGDHHFEVVAADGAGNLGGDAVTVLVDNFPPTVAITVPVDGALVRGTVPFEVAVADDHSGVASVRMLVAGVAPTADASTGYVPPAASDSRAGSEETMRWPDGPLVLSAQATDAAGNESSASIEVVVDNTAPTKALLAPLDGAIVSGTIDLVGASDATDLVQLELFVDDVSQGVATASPIALTYDTTLHGDGPMTVVLVVTDQAGNTSTASATVTVNNLTVGITPASINLKSKSKESFVTVRVEGVGAALLIPTESHAIELRVPGGTPVRSIAGFHGDDAVGDADGDGIPDLSIRFDRASLLASIRAGIAGGQIAPDSNVVVTFFADGRAVGSDVVRVHGP